MTAAPDLCPDALITPTLLAGRPFGPGAHGRVTARTPAAATTANAEPMTSSRRPVRRRNRAGAPLPVAARRGAPGRAAGDPAPAPAAPAASAAAATASATASGRPSARAAV